MIWIAEIGSNHNGSIERALHLVDEAGGVGATHVKFQLFNGEIGKLKEQWLPLEWLPKLRDRSHELGMKFGLSVFYREAIEQALPYVDFFKLSHNYGMVGKLATACDDTGKELIISQEPYKAVSRYCNLASHVLVAIPQYPTPLSVVQLDLINWLDFDGWSDHTRKPSIIYRLVHHWGIDIIEFHLDLDGLGWEYQFGHCWLPHEIEEVIQNVSEGVENG